MQLNRIIWVLPTLLFLVLSSVNYAQDSTNSQKDSSKIALEDIEINFLGSYYSQTGNNSAVTGGIGTEKLTNIAPSVNINIPLDSSQTLNIDAGIDFYSSASTDNIDNPYLIADHVSGPSSSDQRSYVTALYKRKVKKQIQWGAMLGTSLEWDVFSYYGGLSFAATSKDKNQGLDIKLNYYYDDWKLIYPVELRNGNVSYLKDDVRQSINSSIIYSKNLNKRMNAALIFDLVYQKGLLSTPFHRVYFADQDLPVVEQLPGTRVKYPFGIRFNYHITSSIIIKTFYRYYSDSWGLTSNTFELTLPIKVGQALRFYPFYRLHLQQSTEYFGGYKNHNSSDQYFTSDYDLSTFDATQVGLGLTFSPLFGLTRFKYARGRAGMLKSASLRYAYYTRSTGLNAHIITMGLEFRLKQ